MARGRNPGALQPWRRARASRTAPKMPIAIPRPAPPTSSTTALLRWVPLTASVVTAPAMKRLTNGVAMPSLSPLSTLSKRRTPDGTRSSCMMDAPRAASVGATMAPIAAATQSPLLPKRSAAVSAPAPIVSGKPIPSRRAGRATSDRRARTLTREASAKRTRARVTSASERMVDECRLKCDDGGRAVGDDQAQHDEGDRSRDVPALEAGGDESPDDHAGRDDGEGGEVQVVGHRSGVMAVA